MSQTQCMADLVQERGIAERTLTHIQIRRIVRIDPDVSSFRRGHRQVSPRRGTVEPYLLGKSKANIADVIAGLVHSIEVDVGDVAPSLQRANRRRLFARTEPS